MTETAKHETRRTEDVEKLLRTMRIAGSGTRNEKLVSSIALWVSKRDDRPIEEIKEEIRKVMGVSGKASDEDA